MPTTKNLPDKICARFVPPLMHAIFTYCAVSDVTPSRFLQRAAERELRRQSKNFPKLKPKLEKLFREIQEEEEKRYGKLASPDGE